MTRPRRKTDEADYIPGRDLAGDRSGLVDREGVAEYALIRAAPDTDDGENTLLGVSAGGGHAILFDGEQMPRRPGQRIQVLDERSPLVHVHAAISFVSYSGDVLQPAISPDQH